VVKLLLPNNCSENATSIETLEVDNNQELVIFPNPNNGDFSISIHTPENIGKATLVICSSLGVVVYKEIVFCNSPKLAKEITLPEILPGTYFVNFNNGEKDIVSKLLIN
jgi:hypothetical protein